MTYILGINSAYHESSACLLRDGRIIAAVEEERFNRVKHAKIPSILNPNELPEQSIRYCLREGGISFREIDHIGFSFNPERRLLNIAVKDKVKADSWGSRSGETCFYDKIRTVPQKLEGMFGIDISSKFNWIEHHYCHAASSYFVSPYDKAAILSIDGIGEISTTFLGIGEGNRIKIIKELQYPDSLGFLWEKFSKYLGFDEYDAAKVMGLAAYGDSNRYMEEFRSIIRIGNGDFSIDNQVLRFRVEDYGAMEDIFGEKRQSGQQISDRHKDIAAALQHITNEVVLNLARYLKDKTSTENLCIAGGVALNCTTNTRIIYESGFKNIFIQPAANDAGTSIGAAYYIQNQVLGHDKNFVMDSVYLGPKFTDMEVLSEIRNANLEYTEESEVEKKIAYLLSQGKIVGWFQGRMEVGPRALGNRSLLADPRNPNMRNMLNSKVKHREYFRPFAPSVLEEDAGKWFNIYSESLSSNWMLFAFSVKEDKKDIIPAVLHVDGTGRVQIVDNKTNKRFHKLIQEFKILTGVPMILNTSLNDNEPIVCTPKDAINTFMNTKIDSLVLNNYLVTRQ